MANNNLQIFNNPDFGSIDVIVLREVPWWIGSQVADVLQYRDPNDAIKKHVAVEDKMNLTTKIYKEMAYGHNSGDLPELSSDAIYQRLKNAPRGFIVINESGLYSLILSSQLPKAKAFKHWVTSEVLPSIHKTGSYNLPKLTQTEIIAYLANNQVKIEKTLSDHTAHLQLQDAEIKKIADFMYDLSETHRKRVDDLQDRITKLAKSQEPPYPLPDEVETIKLQMRVYNICSWYYQKNPSKTMQQYVDGFNETLTTWLKNRYNIIPAAELFKLRQAYVAVLAVGGTQQSDNISLCHLVTTNKDWLKTAHELCFSLETYYRAQYKTNIK